VKEVTRIASADKPDDAADYREQGDQSARAGASPAPGSPEDPSVGEHSDHQGVGKR
jgi:hypothetical protein